MSRDTGVYISSGVVIFHGKASKHNFNTKITTESEVVAFSEYVPYRIHVINIFLVQVCALQNNIMYQ